MLCLISSLLDSVLFTYFQTVVAGLEVFQGTQNKTSFHDFSQKKPTYCHFSDENTIFKTSIQPKKSGVSRVSLQTEFSNVYPAS